MSSHKLLISVFAVLCCLGLSATAADKKSKDAKADESAKPSYELPQPATENLDLTMYQRIREEGLSHSHVMEFGSGLMDGIGPRLTGSPNLKRANEWTRDQFTAMGCTQRAPRGLGRVWDGVAAAQHVGAHVGAGYGCIYRAGAAVVAFEQGAGERARDLGECEG